jgi:alpha-1,6-mannosyltransferase
LKPSEQNPDEHKTPENYTFDPRKYQLLSGETIWIITLICCGLISGLIYCRLLLLGDLRDHIPEYLFYFFILSLFYFPAGFISTRWTSRSALWVILAFSLAFRLITVFSTPTLSDDVYRYAWEGYLQTQGINPYVWAPDATELIRHRNAVWYSVNNKNVAAIYPPLSQAFNALTFSLSGSIWGFKFLLLILDGVVIWGILRLLGLRAQNLNHVVFYAWNPLIVTEISGSGHNDALVVVLLLWSTICCLTNRPIQSILLLGASILSKLYPILMVPFFFKRVAPRHWLWLPLVLMLGYTPYIRAGSHLFTALSYYKEKWRFNGFLFGTLTQALSSEVVAQRMVVVVVLLLIALSLVKSTDLLRQQYWLLSGMLLLAPTLFPWYLAWIIPLLCFFPNPAWMVFSITSALSYYTLIDWWTLGIWRQSNFFMALQYYPFFGLLLFGWLRNFSSQKSDRGISGSSTTDEGQAIPL